MLSRYDPRYPVVNGYAFQKRSAGTSVALDADRPHTEDCAPLVQQQVDTLAEQQQAVERVILAMYEHLHDPFPLEEMAELAMFSPFYFARVFRRITGIPPAQFLYAVRLQAAKHLLITTHMSVTDICFEVGYNSLGTFSARFAELVGVSPRQLRNLPGDWIVAELEATWLPQFQLSPSAPSRSDICGTIYGRKHTSSGLLFVGAFPEAVPQGRPISCTLSTGGDRFRLPPLPEGNYSLFAASVPWPSDPMTYLLFPPDAGILLGQTFISVRRGNMPTEVQIKLRPAQLTDPPVLTALPLLLGRASAQRRGRGDP